MSGLQQPFLQSVCFLLTCKDCSGKSASRHIVPGHELFCCERLTLKCVMVKAYKAMDIVSLNSVD